MFTINLLRCSPAVHLRIPVTITACLLPHYIAVQMLNFKSDGYMRCTFISLCVILAVDLLKNFWRSCKPGERYRLPRFPLLILTLKGLWNALLMFLNEVASVEVRISCSIKWSFLLSRLPKDLRGAFVLPLADGGFISNTFELEITGYITFNLYSDCTI